MKGPVVLLASAHSGSARPPVEIAAALYEAGIEVAEILAVAELPQEPQGERWREQGIVAVIAAGGDGTIGAAATHIADSGLVLGILPLGTANVTAHSLEVPIDLQAAVALVAAGNVVEIDVGEVSDHTGRRARFLHAATFGLNAAFAKLATDAARRERLGVLAMPTALIEAVTTARACTAVVRLLDGEVVEGPAMLVAAMNLPRLFGRLPVQLGDMSAQDDKLVFLVVRGLLTIDRYEARGARWETETPEVVTVDGEPLLETPVEIRLADRRLKVFLPPSPDEPQGEQVAATG